MFLTEFVFTFFLVIIYLLRKRFQKFLLKLLPLTSGPMGKLSIFDTQTYQLRMSKTQHSSITSRYVRPNAWNAESIAARPKRSIGNSIKTLLHICTSPRELNKRSDVYLRRLTQFGETVPNKGRRRE